MRDKKRFISVILITTVMLFAGGCSKPDETVSAEPTETVKEVETEESAESSEIRDNSEDEAIVEDEIIIIDETVSEETDVDDEDEEVIEDEEITKTETSKTGGSNNGSTNSGSNSGSTNNSQPAHTHNWIEHTATKQVWVPHVVVVDDYEIRVVGHVDDVAICWCGFTTTDRDTIVDHIKNHGSAKENTQFTIQPGYDIIEQVKVGSHEEDHGYYETQTYVDYYYCECGETKK